VIADDVAARAHELNARDLCERLLATAAVWGPDPERITTELEGVHFSDSRHRHLFLEIRERHHAGTWEHGIDVRGLDVVHTFGTLPEHDRAELARLVDEAAPIYNLSAAIAELHHALRARAIVEAAHRVYAGELLSASLVAWLLTEEERAR
jgi:hypothetical protein